MRAAVGSGIRSDNELLKAYSDYCRDPSGFNNSITILTVKRVGIELRLREKTIMSVFEAGPGLVRFLRIQLSWDTAGAFSPVETASVSVSMAFKR